MKMNKQFVIAVLLAFLILTPAHAQENWTEVGLYGFMTAVEGDTKIGNVTSDVDVSFGDILSNLDFGFMGFAEHRRGKWSFIVDVAYLAVSAKETSSRTSVSSLTLEAELKQTLLEGFVGYRLFAHEQGKSEFGIDLLGGARYNKIDIELDVRASLLGLTTSASRNPDEGWVDGVVAARVQYGHDSGWGVGAWADIGGGPDSSSYQFFGTVSYRFKNNVRVFGGYRFYNMDYSDDSGGSTFDLDLDYSGPVIGVAYRF
jgi:hypothetical protein